MHFAGDMRLLLLAHGLQVRGQLAQLRARGIQLQLDALVVGDIPDDAVPYLAAIRLATHGGADIGPAHLAVAIENAPLPAPVLAFLQCQLLAGPVAGLVIGVHQAADAKPRLQQALGGIAHQALTGFADIGHSHRFLRPVPLQAEHQPGHVAGHCLETRLAFL